MTGRQGRAPEPISWIERHAGARHSQATAAGQKHAWHRVFPIWDTFFGVVLVLTVVMTALAPKHSDVDQITAIVLQCGIGVWYCVLGRSVIGPEEPSWRGIAYVVGMIALYVPSVAAAMDSSSLLFVLGPQLFLSMRLGWAVLLLLLLHLAPVAALILDGDSWQAVALYATFAVMITFYSLAFGVWLDRVVLESVERAKLIEQLENARAEVQRLSHEAGVAAERERLAGEIHDTLAQGFTSIVTLVQAAESEVDSDRELARRHLRLAVRTARENLDEARALVGALTPAPLLDSSLVAAVRRLVERVGHELDVPAECVISGQPRRLETDVEVVLLRATQEALANVRKHANAQSVAVSLEFTEEAVLLRIADDGTGFDPQRQPDGFGLPGIKNRTEQVGGAFAVHSAPGEGTVVKVAVPI